MGVLMAQAASSPSSRNYSLLRDYFFEALFIYNPRDYYILLIMVLGGGAGKQ